MAEHDVVKPDKLVAVAAVAVEQELTVPKVFTLKSIDEFKGSNDDTVSHTVEGVLPFRTYGWRNDRSAPIQFDEYKERKVAVSFGGDSYSGVLLTDEQNDMDFDGWTKLAGKQAEAVARGLNYGAVDALEAAPYEIVVTLDEADLRGSLVKLRQIFNRLNVQGRRTLLVDDDLEAALLTDDKMQLASNVGEAEAVSALREATLGRRYGFDFIHATELSHSVAMFESGFVFLNAAPGVPQSVPFGATASHEGIHLTWLRDYDIEHRRDRSVFNTYKGFDYVDDPLIGRDEVSGQAFVSESDHFIRAVKVELGSALDVQLPGLDGDAEAVAKAEELAAITGIADMTPVTP